MVEGQPMRVRTRQSNIHTHDVPDIVGPSGVATSGSALCRYTVSTNSRTKAAKRTITDIPTGWIDELGTWGRNLSRSSGSSGIARLA